MRLKLLDLLYRWKNWLVSLSCPSRLERELEIEMQDHLQSLQQEFEREGMSSEVARKAALRGFGNVESLKEDCRDSWRTRFVMDLICDIRFSVRSLRKSRGFSLTVVAIIALCIGANSTIFSVLYDLILKPLPFENSDRIVKVYNVFKGGQRFEESRAGWNQYADFNEQADMFEGFVLAQSGTKALNGSEIEFRGVTSDFFDLMGVKPLLGRFFTPEEVYPGPGNVMVLTQTVWENDYSADSNIIGKEIKFLIGPSYTIIGVAPCSIEALYPDVRFFAPYSVTPRALDPRQRTWRNGDLWARLKPGISREMASIQLESVERRAIEEKFSKYLATWDLNPKHFEVGPPHPFKSSLALLQGGALFLVIVGCLNIVNLLLVRAARRCSELAVRHSFGAGGLILARMMLVESLLLTTGGLLAGLLLSWSGLEATSYYLMELFPKAQPVTLSGAVFFWTLLMAAVIALIMGLLPLAVLWKSGRIQKMEKNSRSSSISGKTRFLSGSLVILQIGITFALLIGAGLLIRSFRNVLDVDPGFDAVQVVSGYINIYSVYGDKGDWVGGRKRILQAMREIPGVENVSFELGKVAVGNHLNTDRFSIRGGSSNGEAQPDALIKYVDGAFFATMGVDILEGRTFYPGVDELKTSYVIDESFANQYLENRLAIGTEVYREDPPTTNDDWLKVVGVAARANFQGLEKRDGLPVIYICFEQKPLPAFNVLLRTKRSLGSVIREMQAKLNEIDPKLYLNNATTLDKPLGKLHLDREGLTVMAGVFAGLALFLSVIGIYSTLSYDVQQRQREIGIRSAIGASRGEVLTMILQQGLWKAGIGSALGLLASLFLTRFLENLLFDVTALDPQTYVHTIGFLLVVAFIASYLPARRAVNLDPLESLRLE